MPQIGVCRWPETGIKCGLLTSLLMLHINRHTYTHSCKGVHPGGVPKRAVIQSLAYPTPICTVPGVSSPIVNDYGVGFNLVVLVCDRMLQELPTMDYHVVKVTQPCGECAVAFVPFSDLEAGQLEQLQLEQLIGLHEAEHPREDDIEMVSLDEREPRPAVTTTTTI